MQAFGGQLMRQGGQTADDSTTRTCVLKNGQHTVQVVHCAFHGCADVDIKDGWAVFVGLQAGCEVVVIDLTAVQGVDLRKS
jgi:hypothetical protein